MTDDEVRDDVGHRFGLNEPDPDELSYRGPADAIGHDADQPLVETELPGGLDPNVAAYGSGGGGVFLMGVTAWIRRRRQRSELGRLDGER